MGCTVGSAEGCTDSWVKALGSEGERWQAMEVRKTSMTGRCIGALMVPGTAAEAKCRLKSRLMGR